jgi:hypothetical protein
MPWYEPRLTGASGEPPARVGQGKLTRAENFYGGGTAANETVVVMSCQRESIAELPQRFLV